MSDTPLKRCSRGDQCVHPETKNGWLPATTEYFSPRRGKNNRFSSQCRKCRSMYYHRNPEPAKQRAKQRAVEKRDEIRAYKHAWYEKNKPRLLAEAKVYRRDHAEAIAASKRRWMIRRGDHYRLQKRQHYVDNREAYLERNHRRYAVNRDQILAHQKEYAGAHRAERRVTARRYRETHREHIRAQQTRWRINNRATDQATKRRYKARQRGAVGSHTGADIAEIYRSQRGLCWWCGKPVGEDYHVDHRIPLARGGTNYPNNLCISCPRCNQSKKDRLPHEWSDRLL